jgi:5-methylcytosine-specific restriction enzyme subunit McrC
LDKETKGNLQSILPYFNSVSTISINKEDFNYSSWNRNNYHYKWIIELCKWIFKNYILPADSEDEDGYAKTFIENHKNELAILFEKKFTTSLN